MRFPLLAALTAAYAIHLQAPAADAQPPHSGTSTAVRHVLVEGWPVPAWFVPQALCVHSGWHWSSSRPAGRALAEYHLARRWWFRTTDVPDGIRGGSGEASWDTVNSYGGGMQFTLYTYNRAARLSRGRLPVLSSNTQVATLPPAAQIYAAFLIVQSDGGSWREWPQTSLACGLR